MENIIAEISIEIDVPASKVWEALTNPEYIKQYLFGTQVITDWKKGSPIIYKGEWQGKEYEDKGVILNIVPEQVLESTYWSSMGGKEDKPENYNRVKYELERLSETKTKLTLTQDNIGSEEEKAHSESNWNMVLQSLKSILEENSN